MGWLGWTPEVAMAADVNMIRMALEGRRDLLAAIGLLKLPESRESRPMSGDDWQAFKKRHNMRYAVARRRSERGRG